MDDGNSKIDWNLDEVYKFLIGYYGEKLRTLYKEEVLEDEKRDGVIAENLLASTNAVVVPVGAALAIAIVSSAFGAVACYWRQRQKRRKRKYHLNSLKNI